MIDYRPISCCTIFYKVISKILTSRLAEVTEHLLNLTQEAFVKGKVISDNMHLAQELMRHYTRRGISPRCMLKVDLQNAFNSIHWDFLMDVLMDSNFLPNLLCGLENVYHYHLLLSH